MRTGIFQIMILFMTLLAKCYSVVLVKAKQYKILKRKDVVCQFCFCTSTSWCFTSSIFWKCRSIKLFPILWVAIYTKRLKSEIVKYNIFYDYLIKRRFGCDKYLRPQQITYEYFLHSRFLSCISITRLKKM